MPFLIRINLVCFFILFFSNIATAISTNNKIIEIEFQTPEISDQNGFSKITMRKLLPLWKPDWPEIPVRTMKILIPKNKTFRNLKVNIIEQTSIKLEAPIIPSSHVSPLSSPIMLRKPFSPNRKIYSSKRIWPESMAGKTMIQTMTGHRILIFDLHPIQYIPTKNILLFNSKIKITVEFNHKKRNSDHPLLRNRQFDLERIEKFVDNPEDIKLSFIDSQNETPKYEFIIITNKKLRDYKGEYNFQKLLDSKTMTGKIELVEDIDKNFSGKNLGEKIRNFIKFAYKNYGTSYVLLGGDADTRQMSVIPAVGFKASAEGYKDNKIPADMYYGNLDGDFDHNKNGILGEENDGIDGGEVDLISEVFIGRAPIDSTRELLNFVRKTLHYQTLSPDTEYLNNVILAGEYLWTSDQVGKLWGGDHMDQLVDHSDAHEIITTGIPKEANFIKLYEKNDTFDVNRLKQLISVGVHYINHLGHSNNTSNMKLGNNSISGLGNKDKYFFGYTQGCYAGSFDNQSTWGFPITQDAFLEEMLSSPKGAFAYIGNSRYGWGADHSTKGPSHMFHRQFHHGRFEKGIMALGKLNQFSKEQNIGRINDIAIRWCYYQTTLFGDPTLELKSVF